MIERSRLHALEQMIICELGNAARGRNPKSAVLNVIKRVLSRASFDGFELTLVTMVRFPCPTALNFDYHAEATYRLFEENEKKNRKVIILLPPQRDEDNDSIDASLLDLLDYASLNISSASANKDELQPHNDKMEVEWVTADVSLFQIT